MCHGGSRWARAAAAIALQAALVAVDGGAAAHESCCAWPDSRVLEACSCRQVCRGCSRRVRAAAAIAPRAGVVAVDGGQLLSPATGAPKGRHRVHVQGGEGRGHCLQGSTGSCLWLAWPRKRPACTAGLPCPASQQIVLTRHQDVPAGLPMYRAAHVLPGGHASCCRTTAEACSHCRAAMPCGSGHCADQAGSRWRASNEVAPGKQRGGPRQAPAAASAPAAPQTRTSRCPPGACGGGAVQAPCTDTQ